MAFETTKEKPAVAGDQAQQYNCLSPFSDASSNGVKKLVAYVKDNFQSFDLDKGGSISIPELESLSRNSGASAFNRQTASIMISHFDQMANYIEGNDHGSASAYKKMEYSHWGPEAEYVDMASVAISSPSRDITITPGDINAMALSFEPIKRSALEKQFNSGRFYQNLGTEVLAAPFFGTAVGVLGMVPGALAGATVHSALGAIGVGEAAALTAGSAVYGGVAVALAVGAAGWFGYEAYKSMYKDVPDTAAIEKAHSQRKAMLDSWTCSK